MATPSFSIIPTEKPIGVAGLGQSGLATVAFLAQHHFSVLAWDQRLDCAKTLESLSNVTIVYGHAPPISFRECATIVLSPGIRRDHPGLAEAVNHQVPLINDVEWLFRHAQHHNPTTEFIGITGTNGKSTVTSLVGDMVSIDGQKVAVGGNLGPPALSLWHPKTHQWVLELSSFQLESIQQFRPHVAALLNVTPDHLDRYADLEHYLMAKEQIFNQQKKGDWAVINLDDPLLADTYQRLKRRFIGLIPFSIERAIQGGVYAVHDKLIDHRLDNPIVLMDLSHIKLAGRHNRSNAVAATAIALASGASRESVIKTLTNFPGLPHRMAWVRDVQGVSYYNDSKGTNVGAVVQSLQSFSGKVILIAGGRDKKGDFSKLAPWVNTHAAQLILMGEAADSMAQALKGDRVAIHRVTTMEQAVKMAHKLAQPGQTVLLSPACASFDMFRNFEERGEHFQEAVHAL